MPKFDNSKPQLFIHPACSCGDVVDLVKKLSKEIQKFDYKEISLQHSEGRSRAFKVGVKIIPSLWIPRWNYSCRISRNNKR